jgi:peptide/nickel transport system permease protein
MVAARGVPIPLIGVWIEVLVILLPLGRAMAGVAPGLELPMTQALVLLVASVFIIVNFFMDLMYGWLDPRIRYR